MLDRMHRRSNATRLLPRAARHEGEDVYFYYRFQNGHPAINLRDERGDYIVRRLERESLPPDQSVLARYRASEFYPEVAWVADCFAAIQTFREWTFGRYAPLRQPQRTDLPSDRLTPDSRNLALVLNRIEHEGGDEFNAALKRFLPRFERMSTHVRGGVIESFLHVKGLASPVSAARLSDGTLRFMAILATLLNPSPPPVVCIEEPELGLHPDAVVSLSDLLVEASTRMQLVVTTHSEALLAALTPQADSVILCQWGANGTELERVDPAPLRRWLEDDTLGDIWRIGKLGGNR